MLCKESVVQGGENDSARGISPQAAVRMRQKNRQPFIPAGVDNSFHDRLSVKTAKLPSDPGLLPAPYLKYLSRKPLKPWP